MDYSFLRFTDNFEESKDLKNREVSIFDYDMQIHLIPGEAYSCITNFKGEISFSGNYKAYIVNCENEVLLDITDNVYIEEFANDKTGLNQIKFEVINVEANFYTDLVFFRLDQDFVSGKSFWSNPFLFSLYDSKETTRFRFKNYIDLDGTNYRVATIFQSVRLKCIKQRTNYTSSSQSYTSFQGNKLTSRVIKTKSYEFVFDMLNDFIYDRLQYLLTHDVIYVDRIRVTDKQTFESSDKFSDTNIAQSKFRVTVDESDIDDEAYQVKDTPLPPVDPYFDYRIGDYKNNDYKTQ
jgi:hypothetical protein